MSGYATGLLEYSDDPLSDTTPTYVDRSSYVIGDVTWSDGKARDLDEPQAGSITFRLRNDAGQWVPNSEGSLYANSPFLLRRFRWSVNGTPEGIWYVVSWRLTNPAGTAYSEVEVTAVDGHELLSLDNLDLLDPPSAASNEEVIMADGPFLYARLGEAAGTAVTAVAGPEGVYQARTQVTLGRDGAVVGDTDTAVRFGSSGSTWGRARFPMSATENVSDTGSITVECWFRVANASDTGIFVAGPGVAGGDPIWILTKDYKAAADLELSIWTGTAYHIASYNDPGGLDENVWYHFAATYSSNSARLFLNGSEVAVTTSGAAAPDIQAAAANGFLYVGADVDGATGSTNVDLDEIAVYEHVLSPDRIAAHYAAGVQGFVAQTAGERIAAVADSALWSEAGIQTGEHMVHAVMAYGQSKLDEIRAAVKAEMPDTHFFFDGDGDPVYLAWDYKGGGTYSEAQGTFGPADISYSGIELVYDDEMFNEVTVGHESAPGEETQHTVTDDDSIDEFRRRAHAETGLTLTEHHDAIAVAAAILEAFHEPQTRVASLTVNGAHTDARTQILERQIGDLIRVRSVDENVDVLTTILGKTITLTAAGHLACTWATARGLDASAGVWYLGMDGYTELDGASGTTVLG